MKTLCFLTLFLAVFLGVQAAEISTAKDDVLLEIVQKEFAGEDVDFYLPGISRYSVSASTREGEIVSGSVEIDSADGIKAVSLTNAGTLRVELIHAAPEAACVSIHSVGDGEEECSVDVMEGATEVDVDITNISADYIVVRYTVNGKEKGQMKFKH